MSVHKSLAILNGICSSGYMGNRLFYNFGMACVWVVLILLQAPLCAGKPINQVISTSPSWNTFTNQDGTGLYHEILGAIFNPLGIQVMHKYTNANRGLYMVQKELADVYMCRNEINDFPGLTLARHPMYEGKFYAIFQKKRVKDWQGVSSLANRNVVWRQGYYRESEFEVKMNLFEADSGASALAQVILGRLDFYIDDLNLIRESISQNQHPFDMNNYRIEPVGTRAYHPIFKISFRGKTIMDLYDKGIVRLHKSGELRKIFGKWHHPYPGYDIPE